MEDNQIKEKLEVVRLKLNRICEMATSSAHQDMFDYDIPEMAKIDTLPRPVVAEMVAEAAYCYAVLETIREANPDSLKYEIRDFGAKTFNEFRNLLIRQPDFPLFWLSWTQDFRQKVEKMCIQLDPELRVKDAICMYSEHHTPYTLPPATLDQVQEQVTSSEVFHLLRQKFEKHELTLW
jgi:hypothetical protein